MSWQVLGVITISEEVTMKRLIIRFQQPRRDDGSSWLLESDDTIVKGNHRRYRFIYALNEEGIWDHAE